MSPADPRVRVSDAVHEELRDAIVSGRLAAGAAVPSERSLAEAHGVNRHAVREALKRLQQAGLVAITQGGPTRVRDWRTDGGLELLLDLAAGGGTAPGELVRSVLELRALVGREAARRFCATAAPAERERAAVAAEAVVAAIGRGADAETLNAGMTELWRIVVDGSGNVAFRLALNSLVQAVDALPQMGDAVVPRHPPALAALAAALRDGDADGAAAIAGAQLGADVDAAA